MPIDLDPIYHTETMVRILRDQGSPQYAMELAREILKKNPDHVAVKVILGELEEEARRQFEKFKNSGRQTMANLANQANEEIQSEASDVENRTEVIEASEVIEEKGQVVSFPHEVSLQAEKLGRLRAFLAKIQARKKAYETC